MRQDEIIKKVSIGVVETKRKDKDWVQKHCKETGINGAVPKGISGNLSVVEKVWLDK